MVLLFSGNFIPMLPALAVPLVDGLLTYKKISRTNDHIGCAKVIQAVLRSYCAWLYHLSSFVSRYYLLFSPVALLILPLLFLTMAVMHTIACLGQYLLKKPRLSFAVFFYYFTLEQLSYQAGVWWSCLKNEHFGSILPKLSFSIRQAP